MKFNPPKNMRTKKVTKLFTIPYHKILNNQTRKIKCFDVNFMQSKNVPGIKCSILSVWCLNSDYSDKCQDAWVSKEKKTYTIYTNWLKSNMLDTSLAYSNHVCALRSMNETTVDYKQTLNYSIYLTFMFTFISVL